MSTPAPIAPAWYGHYILDNREAYPATDFMTWARWMQANVGNLHVGDTTINGVRISTVFLGLDHAWDGGPPLLFETMVFRSKADGGELDLQERCSTWEQAEAMHETMCNRVRESA